MNPHLKEIGADVLYHFGLDRTMDLPGTFGDVRVVCMGGSNDRMQAFAETLAREIPEWNVRPQGLRPFGTTERFTLLKVGPVLSVSHGMGIGSLRIMIHEITKMLHHAGAKDVEYIRIGTCGGIGVDPGTVILTEEALNPKLEAKDEITTLGRVHAYPTTFDPTLTRALFAQRGDTPTVYGKTIATNCFYEEQTRLDGAVDPGYTRQEQQVFLQHLYALGVRSYEMEATALAGFCNRAGIAAADASVVIVNRLRGDQVTSTHEELSQMSSNAQTIVLRYLRQKFVWTTPLSLSSATAPSQPQPSVQQRGRSSTAWSIPSTRISRKKVENETSSS